MSEPERSSAGSDVRTVLQAALLVLGTGMTFLDGWVIEGSGGVIVAVFLVIVFLNIYRGITKNGPINNGRVIGLAVCVGVTLLVFLSVTLSGR